MPTVLKSREQIIRKIDLAHKRIAKLKTLAQDALDSEQLFLGSDVNETRKFREEADKHFRAIERLEKRRLVKLGRALAEFDTVPLGEGQLIEGLDDAHVAL
jgi:hypothetical protein